MTICVFSNEKFTQIRVVNEETNKQFAEYTPYFEISEKFAVIPGLNEKLIPQGMGYIEDKNWFVLSYYRSTGASVLSCVDADTGTLIKSVPVSNEDGTIYTGHAGGVAVSRLNLWISSGGFLRRIPLSDLYAAQDGEIVRIVDKFNTGTNASFVTFNDDVLWVGEFFHDGNYLTNTDHYVRISIFEVNHSWVTGFKVDAQTDLVQKAVADTGADPVVPDYILSIPDIVQGIVVADNGEIILSRSYGRGNDSTISVYHPIVFEEPVTLKTIEGVEVPIWVLSSKTLSGKITALPMSENIYLKDDMLYILYESAGEKYRATTKYATDYIWKMKLDLLK